MALNADDLDAKFREREILRSKTDRRVAILSQNPLVEFLRARGCELFQSGENLVTGCCPVGEHKKSGHRPVSIDVKKEVWYCNDHKVGGSVIDWQAMQKGITAGEAMISLNGEPTERSS